MRLQAAKSWPPLVMSLWFHKVTLRGWFALREFDVAMIVECDCPADASGLFLTSDKMIAQGNLRSWGRAQGSLSLPLSVCLSHSLSARARVKEKGRAGELVVGVLRLVNRCGDFMAMRKGETHMYWFYRRCANVCARAHFLCFSRVCVCVCVCVCARAPFKIPRNIKVSLHSCPQNSFLRDPHFCAYL